LAERGFHELFAHETISWMVILLISTSQVIIIAGVSCLCHPFVYSLGLMVTK
jgi:hypothetical protein